MSSTKTLMATLICIFAGASTLHSAEPNGDLAKLEGTWTMVSGTADGYAMPEEMVKTGRRVCKGNETTVTINGSVFVKATFDLDPTKNPKTIDYTMTGGFTEGKRQLGIYELNGDTVKFCFGSPGAERPTTFESKPGDGRTLSVWKRTKGPSSAPSTQP